MRGFATIALIFGLGCGSGAESKPPTATDNMTDMKELLQEYQEQYKKSPTKANDLKSFEPVHPMAVRQIQRDFIVVVWGATYGSGTGIIAYPKDAPDKGGTVLLQDGTVKSMTAAEFAAAPKAVKK